MRWIASLLFAVTSAVTLAQSDPYPKWESDKLPPSQFQARRSALLGKMQPGSAVILFTNAEHTRNNDVAFRFRPDSNFLYLSGCEEPDSVLVLAPGGFAIDGKSYTEVLLVRDRDPLRETWNGYRMGPERAADILGIQKTLSLKRFQDVLHALDQANVTLYSTRPVEGPTEELKTMYDDYTKWVEGKKTLSDFGGFISGLRARKSPEEIALIRHAAEVSATGHIEALKSCKPHMREYELQAIVEYCFARGGCEYTAYPSIVGSGPNSTILHYEEDRREMQDGDIVCMDVAGEYHGYAADVTRSFPINGHFSPAQRAIYDLVLETQEAGIALCMVGKKPGDVTKETNRVLADGLIKLGIIKDSAGLKRYYMHSIGHPVGLDVHDRHAAGPFLSGEVWTVEPGVYIPAGSPCDPKWWNIGIRIEDDILVTDGEPDILSAKAPRKAEDVERLMRRKGLASVKIG